MAIACLNQNLLENVLANKKGKVFLFISSFVWC